MIILKVYFLIGLICLAYTTYEMARDPEGIKLIYFPLVAVVIVVAWPLILWLIFEGARDEAMRDRGIR